MLSTYDPAGSSTRMLEDLAERGGAGALAQAPPAQSWMQPSWRPDPETGGWCSPDPLGVAGGLNLFGFEGSPSNDIDPLGLSAWKRSLGNLINMKDMTVREAILKRGGNASTVKLTGHMADKTLEEVAKIKSNPESSKEDARLADTALKLVKQDKTEKAKGCKK